MAKIVTKGAMLKCSFGMAPSSLVIADPTRPKITGMEVATIMDNKTANILPFGMCQSMANPTVASATAAAMGVLTPQPCMPMIAVPWSPAGTEKINGQPVLMENCKCMCNWGGSIEITNPGNTTTEG